MSYIYDFIEEIEILCNTYEEYIYKHKDSKLLFIVENKKLTFLLHNKEETIDEFIIEFNKYETKIYQYISIQTIIMLLGNMKIDNKSNIFYNQKHKPYLRVEIADEEISNLVLNLLKQNPDGIINKNSTLTKGMKVKKLIYPIRFMSQLDMRVELTKRLLRKKNKWLLL